MKIRINNFIVDTNDIFLISEITDSWDCHSGDIFYFRIEFYNDKERQILVKNGLPYTGRHIEDKLFEKAGVTTWGEYKEWQKKQPCYIETLQRVTKQRQELIDIWSNNQSTIPKITFE